MPHRFDDGPARLAQEADGHSVDAQPQRSGDHAQGAISRARSPPIPRRSSRSWTRPRSKGTPMTFAMTFPPGTHAMWMRYFLGGGRHQSRQGRRAGHDAAAADGREHEGRQDGRLLRRRALERARHRRRHRLHGHHHAGHVEGPSRRRSAPSREEFADEEPQDGQGRAQGAARSQRVARRHEKPPRAGGDRLARRPTSTARRS